MQILLARDGCGGKGKFIKAGEHVLGLFGEILPEGLVLVVKVCLDLIYCLIAREFMAACACPPYHHPH